VTFSSLSVQITGCQKSGRAVKLFGTPSECMMWQEPGKVYRLSLPPELLQLREPVY
jgi:hypothetical protein